MNFPYFTSVRNLADEVFANVWVSEDTNVICIEAHLWTTQVTLEGAIRTARELLDKAANHHHADIYTAIQGWCRKFEMAEASALATALLNASTVLQQRMKVAA